jgi:hypothetical protein
MRLGTVIRDLIRLIARCQARERAPVRSKGLQPRSRAAHLDSKPLGHQWALKAAATEAPVREAALLTRGTLSAELVVEQRLTRTQAVFGSTQVTRESRLAAGGPA